MMKTKQVLSETYWSAILTETAWVYIVDLLLPKGILCPTGYLKWRRQPWTSACPIWNMLPLLPPNC